MRSSGISKVITFVFFQFILVTGIAQDPLRFQKEVNDLAAADSTIHRKKLILFTGSSTIRLWSSLKSDFPAHNVLNRGFGGSEMSDLFYYASSLILNYNPRMIFIYEGDNDINSGKSLEEIVSSAEQLVTLIRAQLPRVKIIFISAKPSLARWHLRSKYEEFNGQLRDWTKTKKNVLYADVWTPMLDSSGEVRKDLFLEDNLHMNQSGYAIWVAVLKKYLDRK
jgi:lysophospholipase L1-like esterase